MVDDWLTKGITAGGHMNQPASGDELARFQMGSQNPQNPKQRSHPKILAKYQLFLLEADLET